MHWYTRYFVKSWKIISQSDSVFKTCPINTSSEIELSKFCQKPGFAYIYIYAFSGKRVKGPLLQTKVQWCRVMYIQLQCACMYAISHAQMQSKHPWALAKNMWTIRMGGERLYRDGRLLGRPRYWILQHTVALTPSSECSSVFWMRQRDRPPSPVGQTLQM